MWFEVIKETNSYELNAVIFQLLMSDSSIDAFACLNCQFGKPLNGFCLTLFSLYIVILHPH